jgi:hypothetical protein
MREIGLWILYRRWSEDVANHQDDIQSINIDNNIIWRPITGRQETQYFVHPVFTCAPTSYVTGCVDQHLDGSSVRPSSHLPLKARPARHRKTPLSSEVTQWHAQFTRVAFGVPPRKAHEPLTINRRWPRTITFSCQRLQQSPSRLGAVLSKSNKKSTG